MTGGCMMDLLWLMSRSELTGSRGYAEYFGLADPVGSDYDWSIFTDDE